MNLKHIISFILLALVSCNFGSKKEETGRAIRSKHSDSSLASRNVISDSDSTIISLRFVGNLRECECCSLIVVDQNGEEIDDFRIISYLLTLRKRGTHEMYHVANKGQRFCDGEFEYFSNYAEVGDSIIISNIILNNWPKDGGKYGDEFYFIIR